MCPEGLISKCYKFNESKVTFKLLRSYATVVWASCQKISLTSGYPQISVLDDNFSSCKVLLDFDVF
jgi:hypothetical protein